MLSFLHSQKQYPILHTLIFFLSSSSTLIPLCVCPLSHSNKKPLVASELQVGLYPYFNVEYLSTSDYIIWVLLNFIGFIEFYWLMRRRWICGTGFYSHSGIWGFKSKMGVFGFSDWKFSQFMGDNQGLHNTL